MGLGSTVYSVFCQQPSGGFSIFGDLILERRKARELDFIADALNKIHPDFLTVNGFLEIKNVHFHRELPIIERRAVADVGNAP
jgi:hypothetical protein